MNIKRIGLVLATTLFFCCQVFAVDPVVASVREYRRANELQFLQDFFRLLAIPNIASDRANIRRNADYLMEQMRTRGLNPKLLTAADENAPPSVYGEWIVPGAEQTVVFYAHYDGQPTDPKQWTGSEPWTPVLRSTALESGGQILPMPTNAGEKINPEWRVYARSASDDKAGVFAILKAFDALRANKIQPTVNLKFFFEGEEEAGSPHLADILTRNKNLLQADAWIVLDGPVHQSGRKQVVFGVRGITTVDLTVYGANRALHSGHYGNWSPNPALALARLLSSMKDDGGNVLIKNWLDDVEPLGEAEKQAIKDAPQYDAELRKQLGLARSDGGKSYLEMINLPSLNIAGIKSGDVGAQARNVIPATANAVLDLRLVRGNEQRRQVEKLRRHIRQQGFYLIDREPTQTERLEHPLIVKLIHNGGGYNAQRTALDTPISKIIVRAVETATEQSVVKMPTLGGSLPLAIIVESLDNVPTITVPIANYDNNQHAGNENIRLQNLWDGIEIYAKLMTMEINR